MTALESEVDEQYDIERAQALTREAIALCDKLGLSLAGARLQHGLDLIDPQAAVVIARERARVH